MATRSLGTLTLDLIAKIGGFTAPLDKASRDLDKNLTQMESRAYDFGNAIGKAIKIAFAVFASKELFNAFKSSIDQMEQIYQGAQKVGLGTKEFSTLAYSAVQAGGSIDSLDQALGNLTRSMGGALDQGGKFTSIYKALGIEVKGSDGHLRKSSDVLLDFADRFQQLKGSPEIIAAGIKIFGRSFQDLIPMLTKGSQGIRDNQEEARALGIELDDVSGKAAEEFNSSITRIQAGLQGLFMKLAIQLLPTLDDWSNSIGKLTSDQDNLKTVSDNLTTVMNAIAIAGHAIATVFYVIEAAIKSLVNGAAGAIDQLDAINQLIDHTFTLGFTGKSYKTIWRQFTNAAEDSGSGIKDAWADAEKKVSASIAAMLGAAAKAPKPDAPGEDFGMHDTTANLIKQAKAADALEKRLAGALADPTGKLAKNAAKSADDLALSYGRLEEAMQKLEESATPAQKAYNDYAASIRNISSLAADAIKKGGDVAKVQGDVAQAVSSAQKKLAADLAAPMKAAKAYSDTLDEELQARKDSIQGIVDSVGMGQKEAANLQELNQVRRDGIQALADLQKQRELHPNAQSEEQYQAELEALKKHNHDMLDETKNGQAKITAAQGDWHNGVISAIKDFIAEQNNVAKTAAQLTTDFLNGSSDALAEFISGTKSAGDALKDFINDFEAEVTRAVAKKLLSQLLDIDGGGGSAGIIGAIGSLFGPGTIGAGLAAGGSAAAGSLHRVNERGTELLTVGGRDYLMMGAQGGVVTPSSKVGRGGTQQNNFYLAAPTSQKTQSQIANKLSYQQRLAARLL